MGREVDEDNRQNGCGRETEKGERADEPGQAVTGWTRREYRIGRKSDVIEEGRQRYIVGSVHRRIMEEVGVKQRAGAWEKL